MPLYDNHANFTYPCIKLREFLKVQCNNLIYFDIQPCHVEEQVYEEYSKYCSKTGYRNALALAAYAKVIKLKLYPGVLHYETTAESQEVNRQMILTHDEYVKMKRVFERMANFAESPNDEEEMLEIQHDKEEMLEIQQKRGLATLKYMAWETRVNEENLLDCWFQMTLDSNAYQNMKMKMNKAKEKQRLYDIGPFPQGDEHRDIRYWALQMLGINGFTDDVTAKMIKEQYEILSLQYDPDKEEILTDTMCKDIYERINEAYNWLNKNCPYLIHTESVFNFSGLPLGFQKNKYFVNNGSRSD
jgi:hypothetical protein